MDRPSSGGPDFEAIVSFLNERNRFNSLKLVGFCDHCFAHEGEGCDACDGDYTGCRCTNDHRYGSVLMQLDPRLNPEVNFEALPSRRRVALLLQFVRKVAANYHESYSQEWETLQRRLRMVMTMSMSHALGGRDVGDIVARASATMGLGEQEPNFTLMCPHMSYPRSDEFMAQFKEHNMELYNFVHHMLFTGWAEVDWFGPPGSVSPFRGAFLGDGKDYNDWNGGHREWFEEAMESFLRLHQPTDAENLPAGDRGHGLGPWCSVTQFQYIPKSIQRCIVRTTDIKAARMLGKPLADGIDLFRPLRETYERQKERLGKVNWMPCLGMREEEFVPLRSFRGYTPTSEIGSIRGTTLWAGSV